MKQYKRRSTLSLIGVLILLVSLVAVIPAFASVRGSASIRDAADPTKELSWAKQGGTITLQVTDADLNVATIVTNEALTYTACSAANDLRQVQVANVPIVDKTSDGVVNFNDVTIGSLGNADTSVFIVDGVNGIVTLKCAAASATTTQYVDYKAATQDTVGTSEKPASTTIVRVTSNADSAGIGVVLTETSVQSGIFRATITLTSTDSVAGTSLKVGLTDVVKLSYTDSAPTPTTTVTDTVNVETTDPAASNFSPSHNFGTQSSRPVVSADVTDADSLVKKTTIKVVFALDTSSPFDNIVDSTGEVVVNDFGTLTAITGGWNAEQRLPASMAPTSDAQVFWWIVASDNAGNTGVSDRLASISSTTDTCDPDTFVGLTLTGKTIDDTLANSSQVASCQPYAVKVDFTAPDMASAETGWWWDTTKTTTDKTETTATKAKNTSIAVDFNENIDGTTVQASDFTVDGVAPVSAAHYSGKKNRVFLEVSAMASSAKPTVKLVGQVNDVAGNPLTIDEVTAADGIAPSITVTVTGTGASVPITKDKVTVQFTTDEDATVDASSVVVSPMATATTLGAPLGAVAPTLVTARTWKVDITPGTTGVFNVYVTAKDLAANQGTKGHATDPSKTTAILFEKDTAVGAPVFTPATSTDDPDTFIVIDYAAEGTEYGLDSTGAFTTTAADVVTDKDTHNSVTLTSATLDGTDILADIVTEDNITFLYKASGLALGDHTIKVKATDDAGTTSAEVSHKFKVVATALMKVKLRPGWNLISIPGDAADPAINSVIPSTHPISTVLAYDAVTSSWQTATRDTETGLLVGDLTTITPDRAYWVHTTSFQELAVTPATRETSGALPPTIALQAGWNLVPVAKVDPTAADVSADIYLAGTGWLKAYWFDTLNNKYVAIVPGTTTAPAPNMVAGVGYWVYVPKPTNLVP